VDEALGTAREQPSARAHESSRTLVNVGRIHVHGRWDIVANDSASQSMACNRDHSSLARAQRPRAHTTFRIDSIASAGRLSYPEDVGLVLLRRAVPGAPHRTRQSSAGPRAS
jgi:hypothetical protein